MSVLFNLGRKFIESLNATKPATGQYYRFTPDVCVPPGNIKLVHYNDTRALIEWNNLKGIAEYEFALSNEDIPPSAATTTSQKKANFDGLIPNTTYYFYLRSKCGGEWSRIKFNTSDTHILPYQEGFENAVDNLLPTSITATNNTASFADIFWQTTDAIAAPEGEHVATNAAPFSNGNSWMFTPSFFLLKDVSYTIKYKVSTNGGKNKLLVKYGRKAGEDSMVYSIIDETALSNTSYKVKQATITPTASGNYIIGFGYATDVNDNMIYLDDVSLKQNTSSNAIPFAAVLQPSGQAKLSWQYYPQEDITFILERSTDGIQFKEFGRMQHRKQNTNAFEFYDRKPNNGITYYRVSILMPNGATQSSNKDAIQIQEQVSTALYPNPSSREVFVKMQHTEGIQIRLFDLSGQEVQVSVQNISPQLLKIIPIQPLPPGVYMVHTISSTQTIVLKWMVL